MSTTKTNNAARETGQAGDLVHDTICRICGDSEVSDFRPAFIRGECSDCYENECCAAGDDYEGRMIYGDAQ